MSPMIRAVEVVVPQEDPTSPVACPKCEGAGSTHCRAGCQNGLKPCPGQCLKQCDPGFILRPNGKKEKYYPFRKKGYRGGAWFSLKHVGQEIIYVDNIPVVKGPCPVCIGTTVVNCSACGGTALQACTFCKGTGRVLKAEADVYNAQIHKAHAYGSMTLPDGRVVNGRIYSRSDTLVVIKTDSGEMFFGKPETVVEKAMNEEGIASGVDEKP